MDREWIEAMNAMHPNEWIVNKRQALFEKYKTLPFKKVQGSKKSVRPRQKFDFVEASGRVYDFSKSEDTLTVVTEEGDVMIEQLPMDLMQQGVQVLDLNEALMMEPFSHQIASLVDTQYRQGAFHYMAMNHGLVIIIPKNLNIEKPIDIHQLLLDSQATMVQHLAIFIGENSHVTFKELEDNQGKRYISSVTEVYIGPGSQVSYQTVSRGKNEVNHYSEHHFVLHKDSHLYLERLVTDSGNRTDITNCYLRGSGSCAEVHVASVAQKESEQDFEVNIIHEHSHTESRLIQRGVAFDQSAIYMNADSYIKEGASLSQATQDSRILLMSEESIGDVNPMLEIHNNEVKASHAASLSPMSEDLLYYFMSRGIDEQTARTKYAEGFIKEMINTSMHEILTEILRGGDTHVSN